jgi:hypothetical protein
MSYEMANREFDSCKLRLAEFNPNADYLRDPLTADVRNNLYVLFFPLTNLGDQLDSEIMPLRVQWAMDQGDDILNPNSESWQKFKYLYSLQFGESKTIGLFAPELSYTGVGTSTGDHYDLGRYVRIVYLYVKPGFETEFEEFVHKFIVPTAEKILSYRDEVTKAPPPELRKYYKFAPYWKKLSMNVYMSTIPEFELFVQRKLVVAARESNIPMLTYRTVTGDSHNYHMFFPFSEPSDIHNDRKNLIIHSLLRKQKLESAGLLRVGDTSREAERRQSIEEADSTAEEFLSHLISLEEVVFRTRPDMSAKLSGRYTRESLDIVKARYEANALLEGSGNSLI